MRIYATIISLSSFVLGSCVTPQATHLKADKSVSFDDFIGIYEGVIDKRPAKLRIHDLVAEELRSQLVGDSKDIDRTIPAFSITMVDEIDTPEIAFSKRTYYLLGVNKGPIDQVMIELDDEHHAFERTTTTLKDGILEQRQEMMQLKKGAPKSESQNAGFDVVLSFSLSGNDLRLIQKIHRLGPPWTKYYSNNVTITDSVASFKKVEDLKKKAAIEQSISEAEL